MIGFEPDHDFISLFEPDLIEKPVATFPDHAQPNRPVM
jgi:hypothetical protein